MHVLVKQLCAPMLRASGYIARLRLELVPAPRGRKWHVTLNIHLQTLAVIVSSTALKVIIVGDVVLVLKRCIQEMIRKNTHMIRNIRMLRRNSSFTQKSYSCFEYENIYAKTLCLRNNSMYTQLHVNTQYTQYTQKFCYLRNDTQI